MLKFYLYEAYRPIFSWKKTLNQEVKEGQLDPRLQILKNITQGAVAGLLSQTFIFPIETIKTRVMSETQRGRFGPTVSKAANLNQGVMASSSTSAAGKALTNSAAKTTVSSATKDLIHAPKPPLQKGGNLTLRIAKSMWKEAGPRPFFRGLTPAIASALPYYLTDFTIYEKSKKIYLHVVNKNRPEEEKTKVVNPIYTLFTGMFSNACACSLVYPFALVRTRLQAQGTVGHPMRYKNSLDVIRKTYARESFKGFYNGLVPTLIKNVPSASISFVIYEFCKRVMDLE